MQKLLGQMRAALEKYEMIEAGDRIAVGVSGGKDSLVLLAGLARLRAFYPKPFTLVAITADPGFPGQAADYTQVADLCAELGVEYHLRKTQLYRVIFEERREKNPCSMCARMRRGVLHSMALEHNCNRIALGHHEDDAVETFFMNLLEGGRLGCFSPKSYLSRRALWLIRPMIFCAERDIASAARRQGLPLVKSACPVDGATRRQTMKGYLRELEQTVPDLRAKVMGALSRAALDGWDADSPPPADHLG